jgi:hypothetical protein
MRKRTVTKTVLISIIFINVSALLISTGCAVKHRPIIINVPPNRVAIGGSMDTRQQKVLFKTLEMLLAKPYHPYEYNFPLSADVEYDTHVRDFKSRTGSLIIKGRK